MQSTHFKAANFFEDKFITSGIDFKFFVFAERNSGNKNPRMKSGCKFHFFGRYNVIDVY